MIFDTTKARAEADWFLEYPDELDKRTKSFAMMMRAACNRIDSLQARLALADVALTQAEDCLRDQCSDEPQCDRHDYDVALSSIAAYRAEEEST